MATRTTRIQSADGSTACEYDENGNLTAVNVDTKPLYYPNQGKKTVDHHELVIDTYTDLRRRINEQKIDPPTGKTADQLTEWFLGYQAALFNVFSIIGECEKSL